MADFDPFATPPKAARPATAAGGGDEVDPFAAFAAAPAAAAPAAAPSGDAATAALQAATAAGGIGKLTDPKQQLLAKVEESAVAGKLEPEARSTFVACIQNDVDIAMQVNAIHMCAPGNTATLTTMVAMALKKAPAGLAAPKPVPLKHKSSKPTGLRLQTADPFDSWWAQAETVMSPVRATAPAPKDGPLHNHHDSDSDAEEVGEAESTAGGLTSGGVAAVSTKRPDAFQFNAPVADDLDFFFGRGKGAAPKTEAAISPQPGTAAGFSPPGTPGIAAVTKAGERVSVPGQAAAKHSHVAEVHKDECEGLLYMRVPGPLFSHKWQGRYVVLHKGVIYVYASLYDRKKHADEAVLEIIHLSQSMALSGMKVAPPAASRPRILYRHIAALDHGGVFGDHQHADANEAGQSRVFKYGTDSTEDFERWTAAFNAAIERLKRRERRAAAEALELDGAMSASDAFTEAVKSPRSRPHRRQTMGWGAGLGKLFGAGPGAGVTELGEVEETSMTLSLLDGSTVAVLVHAGGTVKDVLVSVREKLGLAADADFSLYLRDTSGGQEAFTVLPDVMRAAEADAAAGQDSRDLVYKRRMYLPPTAEEAGGSGAGDAPVDLEALTATAPTQAAHRLLYAEALHYVVGGLYMVTLDGGVRLGALAALGLPAIGAYDPAKHDAGGAYLSHHLQALVSTAVVAEWVHVGKAGPAGLTGVPGLLAALAAAHATTAGTSLLAAQKEYIRLVSSLEEYGCAFYHARLLRRPTPRKDVKGSTRAPDTPDWAVEVTTTADAEDTDLEHLPVLVGINHRGVWTRPSPPSHSAGFDLAKYTGAQGGAGPSAAAAGSADGPHSVGSALQRMRDAGGSPVPWMLHAVMFITTFGAHVSRPVFVYQVRERTVVSAELASRQFKEMASTLHAYIFTLLARKQGRAAPHARSGTLDYGAGAMAAKAANRAAREAAGIDPDGGHASLPKGWSEIRDPVTGATAYWDANTKTTVWARPQA